MTFKIEMSSKDIYTLSINILQLWLVLFSTFKEFVEFSHSRLAAQLLKSQLHTKPLLKQIFDSNPLLRTKLFDLKMPI